jgi:hypothetical protein
MQLQTSRIDPACRRRIRARSLVAIWRDSSNSKEEEPLNSPQTTLQTTDPAVSDEDLWQAIEAHGPLGWEECRSEPPPGVDADAWAEHSLTQSGRRRTFIAFYGWAVPDRNAVARIREFAADRELLEVCAGNGLWTRLLAVAGLRARATDAAPIAAAGFVPVEAMEAEAAVLLHRECSALMLSWPPFRSDAAFRALRAFTGDLLIYAGDARFCGDAQFHLLIEKDWLLEEQLPLPSWPGLADRVALYRARH